jgi:cyclase
MPANRIIPSLLLRKGRLVKGVRFADHRDAGAPATTCRVHSAQGADEIAVIDIDASRGRREPDFAALVAIAAEVQVPVTFRGGIDSVMRAGRALESGADKVGVNTTALDRPGLIDELARLVGAQSVVLGLDVSRVDGGLRLYDHRTGSTRASPAVSDWVREAVDRGAGEVHVTAVDREGTRKGLDVALYRTVRELTDVPIILEGGAGSLTHIADAMKAGVDSVGLGTLLVFSDNNLVKVRRFLEGAGLPMRP